MSVNVAVGACDVQIAADDKRLCRILERARVIVQRFEEAHLRGEVFAAIGHVDRRHGHAGHFSGDDAIFVVEGGMGEERPFGGDRLVDVKADS